MLAMKRANIAEVKNQLSAILKAVEGGEEVIICRRNLPVARLVSIARPAANRTRLGWARGRGTVNDDLQGPFVPEESWSMLRPEDPE